MKNDSVEARVLYNYLVNSSSNQGLNCDNVNTVFCNNEYNESNMPDQKFAQIELHWNEMDCSKTNWSYRILTPGKNIIQKTNVFVKKVIRRLLRWYVDPICVQQSTFNAAATRLTGAQLEVLRYFQTQMVQLAENEVQSKTEHAAMTEKLELLEHKFEEKLEIMEKQVEEGNIRCTNLTNELESIKMQIQINSEERFTRNDISAFNNIFFQQVISVSQAGEDRILATLLFSIGKKFEECSYIDIGANHPIELSNTYYFYKLGSQGVLLEANPNLIPELEQIRPRDIILNRCVTTDDKEEVEFFVMNKDGLSTTDKVCAENLLKSDPELELLETVKIKTISVNEIIENYLKKTPIILNIDIEGMELEILQHMDFDKYRPYVIVVENIEVNAQLIENRKDKVLNTFMETVGYREYAFTGINSIFIDNLRG